MKLQLIFKIIIVTTLFLTNMLVAQRIHTDRIKNWETYYRAEQTKYFDLIHTKLKVSFDFKNKQLMGEEWVQLSPHFYPQKQLVLDAKAMDIHTVMLDNMVLKYQYDEMLLTIDLPKTYTAQEKLNIYIKYTANPEKVKQEGSNAISSAKGLYFIDPLENDPIKPTQIWTQGETESNSCWFPTLDTPNQKTSQEIYITVPDKFITLSNGVLTSSEKDTNGNRTDYWKLDQKHAPYLFFMGIGEYEIIHDKWREIPVDYYMEPEYAPYAKAIYGLTPAMIEFFSNYTGVTYPWPKYAQITGADYVSGAMENTTAVIHQQYANQTDKEIADENTWEDVISHELFHHWFGDYVTCENWSNLTLNESFANYGEYLWREHYYGKDHANAHLMENEIRYIKNPTDFTKNLVRNFYETRENMFDLVTYKKGGLILHMLRDVVGDEAFRKALKEYLQTNQYNTAEVTQLRLAFEKITGQDLNWFFDQWYYGHGQPQLKINYIYDSLSQKITVNVKQLQEKTFKFPVKIGVYYPNKKDVKTAFITQKEENLIFESNEKPILINFDDEKVLLAQLEENKTPADYIAQYQSNTTYKDRYLALQKLNSRIAEDEQVLNLFNQALSDSYYGIRLLALSALNIKDVRIKKGVIDEVEKLASKDPNNLVKARALELLANLEDKNYLDLFKENLTQKSAIIPLVSIKAMHQIDPSYTADYFIKNPVEITKINDFTFGIAQIYLESKNKTQLKHLGKFVANYPFIQDENSKKDFIDGFKWLMEENDLESTQDFCTEVLNNANKYKKYQVAKTYIPILVEAIEIKQKANVDATQINLLEETLNKLKTL